MPVDILISRAARFDELDSAPPTRLAELPPPPDAIARPNEWWLMHPGGGPWVAVRERGPNIVLSASVSNRRFLRNLFDAWDLAQELAESLGARVYDEDGTEITRANIDAYLSPSGRYAEQMGALFRAVTEQIAREARAPLELPLGPVDLVDDYFVFHVRPKESLTGDAVHAALGRLGTSRLERAQSDAWLVGPTDTRGFFGRLVGRRNEPLTKVLHRPDGALQIWPTWTAPFAELAPVTLEVAEALQGLGDATFCGTPLDAALGAALRERSTGLGVAFCEWWTARTA